jgi:hypothetical protein
LNNPKLGKDDLIKAIKELVEISLEIQAEIINNHACDKINMAIQLFHIEISKLGITFNQERIVSDRLKNITSHEIKHVRTIKKELRQHYFFSKNNSQEKAYELAPKIQTYVMGENKTLNIQDISGYKSITSNSTKKQVMCGIAICTGLILIGAGIFITVSTVGIGSPFASVPIVVGLSMVKAALIGMLSMGLGAASLGAAYCIYNDSVNPLGTAMKELLKKPETENQLKF